MTRSKWTNPDGSRVECLEDGCDKPVRCTGLCNSHYIKRKNAGSLPEHLTFKGWNNPDGSRKTCSTPECETPVFSAGYCQKHYTLIRRHGSLDAPLRFPKCGSDQCEKRMLPTSTLCKGCYSRMWRYGMKSEQFVEMSRTGNYVCQNEACRSTSKLHLDHDHSCCAQASNLRGGKKACGNCVRGWLCSNCNTALGLLQDDPDLILGLRGYLNKVSGR